MNNKEITYLLNNPNTISKDIDLENIVNEFPYFQAARALQLKQLNNYKSYKYNQELKKTAAYTIDRNVLFEYITSPIFIKNKQTETVLEEIEVVEPEKIENLHQKVVENVPNKQSEIQLENTSKKNTVEEILDVGKPIQFTSLEPHSFVEWMQLVSAKPINRDKKEEDLEKKSSKIEDKFDLIDKFIKTNPKIGPADKTLVNTSISDESTQENESLMTETLAKVYLEQKKYDNAIKAYRILSLKYPEKSGFFADRIKAIKTIQRNKL